MRRITDRRRSAALIFVIAAIAIIAGCGGSSSETNTATTDPSSAAGLPEPGAVGGSSSTDLVALAECFEANAGYIETAFIQGKDPEIVHGEDFGANAPDDIVREAVAAGGWLSAYGDSYGRIRFVDVFEFATTDDAKAAVPAIENGRDPHDNARYGDTYQAVQDGTVVFVLDRPFDETTRSEYDDGVGALLATCLPRASAIRFTAPAGSMSYAIEAP